MYGYMFLFVIQIFLCFFTFKRVCEIKKKREKREIHIFMKITKE